MRINKLASVLIAIVITSHTLALPLAEANCSRLTRAHYGDYKDGIPYCASMFGPYPSSWVEVGWEVWDCDGTYRSWGLICEGLLRDTYENCPVCSGPGGGGPGGGPPEN